jgi:hypothetical protein
VLHFGVKHQTDSFSDEGLLNNFCRVCIFSVENMICIMEQDDLAAKAMKRLCEFTTDRAAANDREAVWALSK